jgi:nicotinate-nucleotide adenylyltransferase
MSYITSSHVSKYYIASTNENSKLNSKEQKSIAVYVGSFDPPHLGHQTVITCLLNMSIIDAVFIVPTYQHCFKNNVSDFKHRVNMLHLAFENVENVYISSIEKELVELHQMTENRTHVTLTYLLKQFPNYRFHLVMGMDVFNTLSTWDNIDSYHDKCLIVIYREGYLIDKQNHKNILDIIPSDNIIFVGKNIPMANISSSHIKTCLTQNNPKLTGLINNNVIEYINTNNDLMKLYQSS